MRRAAVLLALLAGVALGLGACRRGAADATEKPDWRVLQLYGGPGSVEALLHPTRVEVFRVEPAARSPEPGVAYVGLHRVTAGPVEVPADLASELSRILADPDTYDWRHAKSDPYRPTYGLRFTRDVSRVDVALDLASRMLTIHRQGRRIGVEDFDAAAPRVREILTSLLAE